MAEKNMDSLSERLDEISDIGIKKIEPNKAAESEIERRMIHILRSLPIFTHRPSFLSATNWTTVERALKFHPSAFLGQHFIVFCQVPVTKYRADFLVIVRENANFDYPRHHASFFIECDGKEFHSGPGKVTLDVNRHLDIIDITNSHIMRFSGAEIMFCPEIISRVIAMYISSLLSDGGNHHVQKFRHELEYATLFPGIRTNFNSAAGEEFVDELISRHARLQHILKGDELDSSEDD